MLGAFHKLRTATQDLLPVSGLGSDLEDDSAALEDTSPVPEIARTRRSASKLPADRSRAQEGQRQHDDLARRLGRSPSSKRGTTKGASSYPAEAFRDRFLCLREV
jgi:hypothetical protein